VVEELNKYILNIKNMSDSTVLESQNINDQCQGLNHSATELSNMVANFKV
jgi:methyl-accepting chemotaxis protein